MKISVGIGGAVSGHQKIGVVEVRGVHRHKFDLYRPLPFRCQNRRFVVGGGFPLLEGDGVCGTGGQTVSQAVAVVFPGESGFAVHHFNGALVTGGGAGAAAVALLLIDSDNFSDHSLSPLCILEIGFVSGFMFCTLRRRYRVTEISL